ncbi:putative Sir2 family protein [Paratrimastix pyriformis]|uniref:Sir2 family protein n=1 Tax=Paratrimastix pyriformis TaxID=342808 RepID=A0ABQ8UJM5_9EUKA|nr:putative Sir2 family protein [Paratrimastix pyriformis]
MAFSAHKTKEQLEELEEEPANVQEKGRQIAELIRRSRHFICFTGAGISTSAGIPDFRGPEGVWTLAATGGRRTSATTPTLNAVPTFTHMALVALQAAGLLKFVISQNVDGLHRKSGIPVEKLAELHGNLNVEQCLKCRREFLRDFDVPTSRSVHEHRTGRKCAACGGDLKDTIINFGESLPGNQLTAGMTNSMQADLCLCLGSSLTVSPACDMPREVARHGGRTIICNLQRTPLDKLSALRVYARCDALMTAIMGHLGIPVPRFTLARHVRVTTHPGSFMRQRAVDIAAVDADGTPASLFPRVDITQGPWATSGDREPFHFALPAAVSPASPITITLYWQGHYGEPIYSFAHDLAPRTVHLDLTYSPWTGQWYRLGGDGGLAALPPEAVVAPPAPTAAPEAGAAVVPPPRRGVQYRRLGG